MWKHDKWSSSEIDGVTPQKLAGRVNLSFSKMSQIWTHMDL